MTPSHVKYEISSNLGHHRTCTVSDWKKATTRYERSLDTLRFTDICTSDGISQSRFTFYLRTTWCATWRQETV